MWLVILSFGYVDALIPLLIVIILIATAAGLTRGWDALKIFGIEALMGVGAAGKGSLRGKTAYKTKYVQTFSPSGQKATRKLFKLSDRGKNLRVKAGKYYNQKTGNTLAAKLMKAAPAAGVGGVVAGQSANNGNAGGTGNPTGSNAQPNAGSNKSRTRMRMAVSPVGRWMRNRGITMKSVGKVVGGAALTATGLGASNGLKVIKSTSYDKKVERYKVASEKGDEEAKQKTAFKLHQAMMNKGVSPKSAEERKSAGDALKYVENNKNRFNDSDFNKIKSHLNEVNGLDAKAAEVVAKGGTLAEMTVVADKYERNAAARADRKGEWKGMQSSKLLERQTNIARKTEKLKQMKVEKQQKVIMAKGWGASRREIADVKREIKKEMNKKENKITKKERLYQVVDAARTNKSELISLPIMAPLYVAGYAGEGARRGIAKSYDAVTNRIITRISRSGLEETSKTEFDKQKGEPERRDAEFRTYWKDNGDKYKDIVRENAAKGAAVKKVDEQEIENSAKFEAFKVYRRATVGAILAKGTLKTDEKRTFVEPNRGDYDAFDAVHEKKIKEEEEKQIDEFKSNNGGREPTEKEMEDIESKMGTVEVDSKEIKDYKNSLLDINPQNIGKKKSGRS